ncbi:MAG: NADH-quinone oxidoreductase subunit J [Actinomycetota bacterium]
MEMVVFLIAGFFAIVGALGLVFSKNPVHAALSLVMSLFAVAVLFLNQDAQFLAAVQIIVYAGAIVVLFLFVIMLLGVDESEDLSIEPIAGQRPVALLIGAAVLVLSIIFVAVSVDGGATGAEAQVGEKVDSLTNSSQVSATELLTDDVPGEDDAQIDGREANPNIDQLGRTLFTDYVFAFEITALLLTIAVVGAVLLARRPKGELAPMPELPVLDEGSADEADESADDAAAADEGSAS